MKSCNLQISTFYFPKQFPLKYIIKLKEELDNKNKNFHLQHNGRHTGTFAACSYSEIFPMSQNVSVFPLLLTLQQSVTLLFCINLSLFEHDFATQKESFR